MKRVSQAFCLADCGKRVKRKPAKFCSLRCQKTFEYRIFVGRWLAGEIDGTKSYDVASNHIRRYMAEKYGACCQICGWAERNSHTGRIPVHLDHIDGNARNNSEENLRYLCPNHHALTGTFGGANVGKGRPARRARYLRVVRTDETA